MKTILFFLFSVGVANAQISDFKAVDFTQADHMAKLYEGEGLDNMPALVYKLTNTLTSPIEKFRAIYMWVCNNIACDINQDNTVTRKRQVFKNDSLGYVNWNNTYKKKAFKKLLKHNKTMCTGYAYLIKELCFLAQIDCVIINGYGRTANANVESLELVNHSWNAVNLNNKWYLCDATWSSGYNLIGSGFIKSYNDGYFLTNPELFALNHYPVDKKWLLNNDKKMSEYVLAPLVYGHTFRYGVEPVSPDKLHVQAIVDDEIDFRFKALNGINPETLAMVRFVGDDLVKLKIYDVVKEQDQISFKCQFKRKGVFDAHLKINDDIIATYVVEVATNKKSQ
ncbi:transglutaminase domain-containing protein [Aestuariibaculum sediminum]|uniref:Transglutaminase-like domain-containing protein n=1 Tax=Aestuariibaculum sediminum TaxID=2770637 RepID=A0A8J6Q8V9_9FLAO|nr:transglutaminase domain-containing protein [Aestuariibaculum sediminum]MBD0833075.1 hypothetical protein [Aestuariibaculum sediminum]